MHRTRARAPTTTAARKPAAKATDENAVPEATVGKGVAGSKAVFGSSAIPRATGRPNANEPVKKVMTKSVISTTVVATNAAPRRVLAVKNNAEVKNEIKGTTSKDAKDAKPVAAKPSIKRPASQSDTEKDIKRQRVQPKTAPVPSKSVAAVKRSNSVKKDVKAEEEEAPPEVAAEPEEKVEEKTPQDWDDLDKDDHGDPLMVSEYVGEIFEYFKELERDTMPSANYMENQKELAWRMRGILIDWLIEVHYKFRLLPETLFLAVNIIDRFLTCRIVSVQKLQLVGLTSLFIASKYEEVMAPSIQNFIYMSDNGYTEDEIMKAERYILQVLDYGLHYPNALNFLRRCSKADNYDIQTRTLAKYLMEVALIDYKCLVCPPSEIAAAGLYLARRMLRRGPWDANLVHYSGYTEDKLQTSTSLMLQYLRQTPPRHEALFRKYASKKFMKASLFVKDWVERQSANAATAAVTADESDEEEEERETEEEDEDSNE